MQIVSKAFLILFHADTMGHVLINFTKLIRGWAIFCIQDIRTFISL